MPRYFFFVVVAVDGILANGGVSAFLDRILSDAPNPTPPCELVPYNLHLMPARDLALVLGAIIRSSAALNSKYGGNRVMHDADAPISAGALELPTGSWIKQSALTTIAKGWRIPKRAMQSL